MSDEKKNEKIQGINDPSEWDALPDERKFQIALLGLASMTFTMTDVMRELLDNDEAMEVLMADRNYAALHNGYTLLDQFSDHLKPALLRVMGDEDVADAFMHIYKDRLKQVVAPVVFGEVSKVDAVLKKAHEMEERQRREEATRTLKDMKARLDKIQKETVEK